MKITQHNLSLGQSLKWFGECLGLGRRSPQWSGVVVSVPVLLGGLAGIVAPEFRVEAQPISPDARFSQWIAQERLPALPVPPNLPFPSDSPALPPIGVPPAPPPDLPPLPSSKRYVVYIPNTNPFVLGQVKLVEPEAFIKDYGGRSVIQAGLFVNRSNAERRAREIELRVGVRSAIDTIEDVLPPIATAFPPPPSPDFAGNVASFGIPGGYFVVIPGNPQEFPRITSELIEAGINDREISTRNMPFGPHLAIGPFPDLVTARQESGYIRRFGIDARVYQYDR